MEMIPRAKRVLREPSNDRISDLPNNVIDHIIRFLSIEDAARMSALSKTWRSNWLSLPRLVFDGEIAGPINSDRDALKWFNIISNILFLHRGSIIEFSLTIPGLPPSSHVDIIPWLSFVVKILTFRNFTEELYIRLPSCFFSSPRLENLTLHQCIIGRLSCFRGLRNLLSLDLTKVVFEAGVFEEFIAACTALEKLTLSRCTTDDTMIINSPNLKVLHVNDIFKSISFKSASSLVLVTLDLNNTHAFEWADMMNSLSNLCRLQTLCLYGRTCESLANCGISRILPTTFKHLKILELCNLGMNHKEFLFAIGVIRSCPYVEELVLMMRRKSKEVNEEELKIPGNDETNCDDDGYTFNHLRSISLTCVRGLALEMRLISYLLASSPSLERLLFTCCNLEAREELQLLRQMLQFQRASSRAQVKQIGVASSR